MRRLFFLTPNVDSCQAIVDELEQTGVPQRHLHVIASIGQALDGLPKAGLLQKTEFLHGLAIGAGLGGTAGILGGLLAMAFPPAGIMLGIDALLAGAAAGAGFGAVVSALMSSHKHNHDLNAFEQAIERGEILLMVDVPRKAVNQTKELILGHHAEAKIGIAKLAKD